MVLLKNEISSLKKIIEEHENRITAIEAKLASSFTVETKKLKKQSIKEFLMQKSPNDDNQKTLVIGYFLEHYEGVSSFNVKDLIKGFRSAKEPVPQNINDKVNQNIKKAYMMSAEAKKENKTAWVLTSSGEKFVENKITRER